MERIAVTGANGKTGRAVIAAAQGKWRIRALARTDQQAAALRTQGHDVVIGDMADPQTLAAMTTDVVALYHICPNFHPAEVQIGALVAAAAENVEQLVYHSVLHPQTEAMPHHWRKLRVEELLLRCRRGRVTFLRPAPYVQNLSPYLPAAIEQGELRIPYDVDSTTAMVDLADVGEAAVAALDGTIEPGSGWDLCGVAATSHRQIAQKLSAIIDRPIEAVEVVADTASPELQHMFDYMGAHGLPASTGQLRSIIGEPTPFDDSLRRLVATAREAAR